MNLWDFWQKGSIFNIRPQNDHVYLSIHKFDILAGASFEYAIYLNLAVTDPPPLSQGEQWGLPILKWGLCL